MIQKKIIILGGQGFIGINICKILFNKKKKYKLILIGNNSKLKNIFNDGEKKKLKIYNIDIFNIEKLPLNLFKNSIVINTALISKIPLLTFKKKYLKLCNQLKKRNINKFILLSTIAVYGNEVQKISSENLKINPISSYGKRCFEAEKISKKILKNKSIILRITNIFGKYRFNKGVIEKILSNSISNVKFALDKSIYKRTYIYAPTLVKIILILISKKIEENFIFNIGNPYYIYNFKQLKKRIETTLKNKIPTIESNEKIVNNFHSVCYPKKFVEKFKFKFHDNFEKEILETLSFLKKR